MFKKEKTLGKKKEIGRYSNTGTTFPDGSQNTFLRGSVKISTLASRAEAVNLIPARYAQTNLSKSQSS